MNQNSTSSCNKSRKNCCVKVRAFIKYLLVCFVIDSAKNLALHIYTLEERLHQEVEEVELCEQLNRQHLEHEIEEFQDWEEHKSVVCETRRARRVSIVPRGQSGPARTRWSNMSQPYEMVHAHCNYYKTRNHLKT